ncbi:MAG: DNA polymerase III subunit gamma/tau [Candidatus Abawacabacteria bacterium]|nr:DNA polymerase III subunit gamma/tau [Candidatus Abawacabacteria bacterium]
MGHTVFYRKYRPDNFAHLIGQEAVAETVLQALKEKSVSHAYLLCGPRGTGKTTIARLLAKGVNCTNLNANGEACTTCANCLAIKDGSFPDIIEIDAASNRSIDDIRELKDKVHFMPLQGIKKVYIIDEVHMLTKEAFNALLKTLEEPPAHVHFILATTERHKVPATIVSRTQNFTLKPLSEDKIIELLKRVIAAEHIEAEDQALKMIAQASEGGLRDALTLLEQCVLAKKVSTQHVINQLGFVHTEVIEKFVALWQTADATTKLAYLRELYEQGILVDQFVKQALLYIRDAMHQDINNQAARAWYIKALEALLDCEKKLNISPLPILALELAYLSLEGITNYESGGELVESIRITNEETTDKESVTGVQAPQAINTHPTQNSEFRIQNSVSLVVDSTLQSKWQFATKSLSPTLRLALRNSDIVKENGRFVIYINSNFELAKVNTNAGIQIVRELIATNIGESLDVELKVKEDQPQAAEILTKVQAIFGGQTTTA